MSMRILAAVIAASFGVTGVAAACDEGAYTAAGYVNAALGAQGIQRQFTTGDACFTASEAGWTDKPTEHHVPGMGIAANGSDGQGRNFFLAIMPGFGVDAAIAGVQVYKPGLALTAAGGSVWTGSYQKDGTTFQVTAWIEEVEGGRTIAYVWALADGFDLRAITFSE